MEEPNDSIEQLLATDSAFIQRQTKAALQSGALRNIHAPHNSPNLFSVIALTLTSLTLATLLIVFTLPHFFSHEQIAIPVVATKLPVPEMPVASQSKPMKSRTLATVAKVRQPIRTRKAQHFPSPTPLTSQERALMTLARLQPRHLEELLQAQQKFQEDFAREKQNFEIKLEKEKEFNDR